MHYAPWFESGRYTADRDGWVEGAQQAAAQVRQLAYELRPPELDAHGLAGASRAAGLDRLSFEHVPGSHSELRLFTYAGGRRAAQVPALRLRGGELRGTFKTAVGLSKPEQAFDLHGSLVDDLIAFTVSFPQHGSITSWVGHVVGHGARLETVWHMTVRTPHPENRGEAWKGIWTGADSFSRTEPATVDVETTRRPPHPIRRCTCDGESSSRSAETAIAQGSSSARSST